jgi:hypothetical protein
MRPYTPAELVVIEQIVEKAARVADHQHPGRDSAFAWNVTFHRLVSQAKAAAGLIEAPREDPPTTH